MCVGGGDSSKSLKLKNKAVVFVFVIAGLPKNPWGIRFFVLPGGESPSLLSLSKRLGVWVIGVGVYYANYDRIQNHSCHSGRQLGLAWHDEPGGGERAEQKGK